MLKDTLLLTQADQGKPLDKGAFEQNTEEIWEQLRKEQCWENE